jgi:hypothetical protein
LIVREDPRSLVFYITPQSVAKGSCGPEIP